MSIKHATLGLTDKTCVMYNVADHEICQKLNFVRALKQFQVAWIKVTITDDQAAIQTQGNYHAIVLNIKMLCHHPYALILFPFFKRSSLATVPPPFE